MTEIISIKDLRNTNGISRVCHEQNEPVYIAKNGYSMETHKEKLEKANLYEMLAEAEMELNSKEDLFDPEKVFEKLKIGTEKIISI